MEKKKNSKHYIIPASYFKKKGITPIPVKVPNQQDKVLNTASVKNPTDTNLNRAELNSSSEVVKSFQVKEPLKIVLKQGAKRTSGLSLSSIRAKKEHLIKQMDVIIDEEDLPKEPFTEEQLITVWNDFIKILQKKGKHNLASILSIDTPKVRETTVYLEFPNGTNKIEVERQQYDLLAHVRKALNNFDISLSISVNEEKEKQYAFTNMDKFEKLNEKNPNLDLLRKAFDLDI